MEVTERGLRADGTAETGDRGFEPLGVEEQPGGCGFDEGGRDLLVVVPAGGDVLDECVRHGRNVTETAVISVSARLHVDSPGSENRL